MSATERARKYGEPNDTLYVEDLDISRNHVVDLLKERSFSNVTAPGSIDECARLVTNGSFRRAVIDFDLQDWVGIDKTSPIWIGDRMVCNGVQLAEELRARDTEIQLALFSAYSVDLRKALERSPLAQSADVVVLDPDEVEDPARHITGFMERTHNLGLVLHPVHERALLPEEIQCFLATRFLAATTAGQDVWSTGGYSWLVGINEPPPYQDAPTSEDLSPNSKFSLEVDRSEFRISAVVYTETGERLSLANPLDNDFSQPRTLLAEFLLAKSLAAYWIRHRGADNEVIRLVKGLDANAVFEFQKSVFKLMAAEFDVGTKEDVYERVERFRTAGLPHILDVFECRIDSRSEGLIYVKAESLSPERIVRQEVFDEAFLWESSILNGPFEMTIWDPEIKGGAFNLQPI